MNHSKTAVVFDPQLRVKPLQSALEILFQKVDSLKQQLNCFKRQMFDEESEKRLTAENSDPVDLSEIFTTPSLAQIPENKTVVHERRKK